MDIGQAVHGTKGIVPVVTHDWEGRCRELEAENKRLFRLLEGLWNEADSEGLHSPFVFETLDKYPAFHKNRKATQALKGAKMKRYGLNEFGDLYEAAGGCYCEHKDVEALEAENKRLREAGSELSNYIDVHFGSCDMVDNWDKALKGSE